MVTEAKGLESLKELKVPHNIQDAAVERVALEDVKPIVDELGRSYGTGKRKNAIARVWIKPGKGKITVNGKDFNKYFARPAYQIQVEVPFKIAGREKMFDVVATVTGGGLTGQSEAVRHGISKALTYFEPMLRIPLKKAGLLTRDSRVVERKKYGLHKARRSTQFSKR